MQDEVAPASVMFPRKFATAFACAVFPAAQAMWRWKDENVCVDVLSCDHSGLTEDVVSPVSVQSEVVKDRGRSRAFGGYHTCPCAGARSPINERKLRARIPADTGELTVVTVRLRLQCHFARRMAEVAPRTHAYLAAS